MNQALEHAKIAISRIEMQRKHFTIYGFIEVNGQPTEYTCDMQQDALEYLLVRNRAVGQQIIYALDEIRTQPHCVPICFDLVEKFGTTQEFIKP